MKKLFISLLAFSVTVFPLLAQIDHDYNPNDRIPIVNATITKEQVPPAVLKAVNTNFDKNKPETWSKFPFALKEYGWVYDVGASNLNLNHYEVTMKTPQGDELWAVYNAEGLLLETRETMKNVPLPSYVKEQLAQSQYKDWNVVGDKEVIKYYHDKDAASAEQHLRVTLEKDKVRRSVSFNYQAGK
jgi:hypothetical protein